MGNSAIRIFGNVLDNSDNIVSEIKNEVYKLLGITTQSKQLIEYIQECLEKFSFNAVESQFLGQLRSVIGEELNKNNLKIKNNMDVDYEQFTNAMIESLRQVNLANIYLDDDLKNLANNIVNRFPYSNVTSDQIYLHVSSKKEQIINMINRHNQDIIDTLIKFTPQLAAELSNQANVKQNNAPVQEQQEQNANNNDISIDKFLSRCAQKLNELDVMFKKGGNAKSEIAKGFRQLKSFIANLNDKTFAQGILDRYTKLNEATQGIIYDNIIFENVPVLKEIYKKYDSLLAIQGKELVGEELNRNVEKNFAPPISTPEPRVVNENETISYESTVENALGSQDNHLTDLQNTQVKQVETPIQIDQEQQIKNNLIQQIMNAMNKNGEMAFGDISFSDRINRMNSIKSGLESKSIDDLQVLLSTYQEQFLEEQSTVMKK